MPLCFPLLYLWLLSLCRGLRLAASLSEPQLRWDMAGYSEVKLISMPHCFSFQLGTMKECNSANPLVLNFIELLLHCCTVLLNFAAQHGEHVAKKGSTKSTQLMYKTCSTERLLFQEHTKPNNQGNLTPGLAYLAWWEHWPTSLMNLDGLKSYVKQRTQFPSTLYRINIGCKKCMTCKFHSWYAQICSKTSKRRKWADVLANGQNGQYHSISFWILALSQSQGRNRKMKASLLLLTSFGELKTSRNTRDDPDSTQSFWIF